MAVSLEALAMTGADYVECGMTIEEWERLDVETPPHLLADDVEEEEWRREKDDDSPRIQNIRPQQDYERRRKRDSALGLHGTMKKHNMLSEILSSIGMMKTINAC